MGGPVILEAWVLFLPLRFPLTADKEEVPAASWHFVRVS
jgi:hypothetical protein